MQAFIPAMAERGFGRLIAIGSIQQVKEHRDMLAYAASKAALESMVRKDAAGDLLSLQRPPLCRDRDGLPR
ncbi:hypothetical protein ASE66_08515 [Bosea sp. Root483D1]|uniref:SDR family NAD(P)-dependent oxidoreductase n=1 Tax=Bosea sp. Root483D1 TaxID=1736544 RepID=UPI00070BC543|nr:SDR family NAD(P)-dependent oxidoreductase [Bosea sp. Root483D1]KRE20859.1 hypothetical protein ASE66_08515 [Bosea sp. Root483D1]